MATDRTEDEHAGLHDEMAALTEAVRQMVATLQAQGELLAALFQAVTAPEAGEAGLTEVLERIADSLELQSQDLAAIRAGLVARPGGSRVGDLVP